MYLKERVFSMIFMVRDIISRFEVLGWQVVQIFDYLVKARHKVTRGRLP